MKKVIRLTESDLKRIVRRVLNEDVDPTTPTGVADSSGEYITLDKNSSLGILDGTEYRLHNSDPVFKNYNTTKKIPNGVDYNLRIVKIIYNSKLLALFLVYNILDQLYLVLALFLVDNILDQLYLVLQFVCFY